MVRRLSPVGSPPTSYVETALYEVPSGTLQAGGLIYNSNTDMLYVALSGLGISGVWQIDTTLANPTVEPYALISGSSYPSAGFMGMTSDADGTIYIADTISGWIFQVPDGGGTFSEWANANTLGLPTPFPPGPNGLKFSADGQLYVTHSFDEKIMRYPVNPDGSAGTPTTFVGGIGSGMFVDDFTFGASGNLYLATEPGMTVEMITPSAKRTVIAGYFDGLEHPTAVQCGVLPGDTTNLYIVTLSPPGVPWPAGVYRMGIGEECLALNDGPG